MSRGGAGERAILAREYIPGMASRRDNLDGLDELTSSRVPAWIRGVRGVEFMFALTAWRSGYFWAARRLKTNATVLGLEHTKP